ncbi:MAG: hypothetical protein AAB250_10675 [Bdellovibrionota bacterium]
MSFATALKKKPVQALIAIGGLLLGSLAIFFGVLSTAMGDVQYQCRPFMEGDTFDKQLYFKRMRDLRTDREVESYTINRSPPVDVYIFKMPAMLGRGAQCEIRVSSKLITSVRYSQY